MRKLLAFVVFVVLLMLGDLAAKAYATSTLEDQLASALRLKGKPRVVIEEFPFTLALIRGRMDRVRISARGVSAEEIELSDAAVTLNDVRFSTSKALRGDLRAVGFSTAQGSALITLTALEKAVDRVPIDFTLPSLDPGTIRLANNALDLGAFQLELPVIANGMTYEQLHVVNGGLHLMFTLDGKKLRL